MNALFFLPLLVNIFGLHPRNAVYIKHILLQECNCLLLYKNFMIQIS